MLRTPNRQEEKDQMNCTTCSYLKICKIFGYRYMEETICRYYANPEKGKPLDPKKEKQIRKNDAPQT